MDLSHQDDSTDFRPFFDMVIGILFVLLILVAAQIYFQQVQDQDATTQSAKRDAALRRAEIATFVTTLAERLRRDGIAAVADVDAGTVVLPLGDVLGLDGDGLPEIDAAHAGLLGTTLVSLDGCVTVPRSEGPDCAAFDRLQLDMLGVSVRIGTSPPGAALPRDRFGDLSSTLLSASLLGRTPDLIRASNPSGARVVSFGAALTTPRSVGDTPDGDVALDFTFR